MCLRAGSQPGMRRGTVVLMIVAAGLVGSAEPASASISIAKNVSRPALRVDARGNAEVSWSSGGTRRTLLIPATGLYLPGGHISTKDVSRRAGVEQRAACRSSPVSGEAG